jgi:microcystin-dependent protein
MKALSLSILALLFAIFSYAQNTGINTISPTAKVDVNGDLRIATLPAGTATSDLVMVVDASGNIKKVTLCDLQNAVYGDIKDSRLTADHCGWYLLNGRAINTLSATAQAQATALGFSTNLPNFTNRYVRAKQGAEVLASTGGATTVTLAQANMPQFTMNITATAIADDHTHDIVDRNNFNPTGVLGNFANVNNGGNYNSRPANAIITTLSTSGAHTHPFSLSSNGGGGSLSLIPAFINYASFVYLGL